MRVTSKGQVTIPVEVLRRPGSSPTPSSSSSWTRRVCGSAPRKRLARRGAASRLRGRATVR